MTNQPFAVPGQRVRWAVAELRKAGINADVQRGPGGAYYITVDDDDHDWAAGTLGPMMAPPTMRGESSGNGIKDWIAPGLAALAAAYFALSGLWMLAGVFLGAGAIMRAVYWLQDVAHGRAVRSRNPWGARLLWVAGLAGAALFVYVAITVGALSGLKW